LLARRHAVLIFWRRHRAVFSPAAWACSQSSGSGTVGIQPEPKRARHDSDSRGDLVSADTDRTPATTRQRSWCSTCDAACAARVLSRGQRRAATDKTRCSSLSSTSVGMQTRLIEGPVGTFNNFELTHRIATDTRGSRSVDGQHRRAGQCRATTPTADQLQVEGADHRLAAVVPRLDPWGVMGVWVWVVPGLSHHKRTNAKASTSSRAIRALRTYPLRQRGAFGPAGHAHRDLRRRGRMDRRGGPASWAPLRAGSGALIINGAVRFAAGAHVQGVGLGPARRSRRANTGSCDQSDHPASTESAATPQRRPLRRSASAR